MTAQLRILNICSKKIINESRWFFKINLSLQISIIFHRPNPEKKFNDFKFLRKKEAAKVLLTMATQSAHAVLSRGYTSDFLLVQGMRFFQILLRRQREMKIARVALELVTRQVKKSQEKSRQN